jgi:hypothetical protein
LSLDDKHGKVSFLNVPDSNPDPKSMPKSDPDPIEKILGSSTLKKRL